MVKDATDFSLSPRRLPPKLIVSPPNRKSNLGCLILCSSRSQGVKFSELSLDGFRMMLTFERELGSGGKSATEKSASNPLKYILYRPSVSTLLQYISSAQKEAREATGLLLYISADGDKSFSMRGNQESARPYSKGGIILRAESKQEPAGSLYVAKDNLYPDDLLPFLRRPLFLIVDSENSAAFTALSSTIFGAPVLILASPARQLPGLLEPEQAGSVFTLFLSDPIAAFCFVVSRQVMTSAIYQELLLIASAMFDKLNSVISSMSDLRTLMRWSCIGDR